MEFAAASKKKKLNFDGKSFGGEVEFKIPCQDVTNNFEQDTRPRVTNASSFADDEESSRDSTEFSASAAGNRDTVNVSDWLGDSSAVACFPAFVVSSPPAVSSFSSAAPSLSAL
jgi:hypothetical protein